jgi:K+-sensing histidine kinase KdpD
LTFSRDTLGVASKKQQQLSILSAATRYRGILRVGEGELMMGLRLSGRLGTIVGVVLCAAMSALTAVLFASRASRPVVPLVFVGVILALAVRYGPAVGLFGSLVAALIFSVFLFEPVHNVRVQSAAARANIGWMLLAGIALSYLLAGPPQKPDKN